MVVQYFPKEPIPRYVVMEWDADREGKLPISKSPRHKNFKLGRKKLLTNREIEISFTLILPYGTEERIKQIHNDAKAFKPSSSGWLHFLDCHQQVDRADLDGDGDLEPEKGNQPIGMSLRYDERSDQIFMEFRLHGDNKEFTSSKPKTQLHICIGHDIEHKKREKLQSEYSRRDVVNTDPLADGQEWDIRVNTMFGSGDGWCKLFLNDVLIWEDKGLHNYMPVVDKPNVACREPYWGIYTNPGATGIQQIIIDEPRWEYI